MAYLAVLSTFTGRRTGVAATLGIALGLMLIGLASALGLAAVIANSRLLYEGLRWIGALYLFWLAWEGWRGEQETSPGNAPWPTDMPSSRFCSRISDGSCPHSIAAPPYVLPARG